MRVWRGGESFRKRKREREREKEKERERKRKKKDKDRERAKGQTGGDNRQCCCVLLCVRMSQKPVLGSHIRQSSESRVDGVGYYC